MNKITFAQSVKLTSPHMFAAIVTKSTKVNVMGVSWFTFVSMKDSKLLFALSNKSYTSSVILQTKRATLCMVTEKNKDAVLQSCGCSGHTTDKTAVFELNTAEAENFHAPILRDSSICWNLSLSGYTVAGDHTVYIMDVSDTIKLSDAPHVMAFDGYKRLDFAAE